jgi:hypothetical protein
MKFYRPAVLLAHSLWATRVKRGDIVIDATCGRGHDSVQLANLVFGASPSVHLVQDATVSQPCGELHCVDVQQEAIASTQAALMQAGFAEGVSYHCQSHARFPSTIQRGSVSAVVYNLGYLPKGNKEVISTPESSVASINAATELLLPNGFISVLAYRGHAGGNPEYTSIISNIAERYASEADWKISYHPASDNPLSPVLVFMEKLTYQTRPQQYFQG